MKKCGLLGEKLGHSFSPQLHAMMGDYEYKLYEKAPAELDDFLKTADFDGINVTIPYKKTVIPYCASLSQRAEKIGSVNLLLRQKDGTLHGGNTDYFGFEYMLQKSGIDVAGKKAIVLGNGGASQTIQAVLRDKGAQPIIVISRSGENNYENLSRHADAEIIVNTTPVGMRPNNWQKPIDLSAFPSCKGVLDIIANPVKTALLLEAEDRKIPSIGGLTMLVAQAKEAAEFFGGKAISENVIDKIIAKMTRTMQNIVLIGMPGCGKTTIGRYLSEITERQFLDTDDIIEQKSGKTIPEIIESQGEEAFRILETEAFREAAAAGGNVIATGGGIITKEENHRIIRQNCVAIFLDRNISELPTENRPLSQKIGVEALAAERIPIYKEWCDHAILVCGEKETALAIKELLKI